MSATATITVRLPEDEKRLIAEYADMFGLSTSELVRESVMERIEDEMDTRDLLEAMSEDDGTRYSMAEVLEIVRGAR